MLNLIFDLDATLIDSVLLDDNDTKILFKQIRDIVKYFI